MPPAAQAASTSSEPVSARPSKYAIERAAQVPAPGWRAGPIASQNGGSIGSGKAPPALGLPPTTTISTARPMPTTPVAASRASVSAPTEKTTSAPSPHSPHRLPGSAPRTGPTTTAPPRPPAIA
ncbi:hypothetical protein GT036_30255 [Streptomyces sp. SID4915]|nr:hypothetical protein [Streptomyces sp. SID4915]SCE10444.1 hypothetical protein GA0115250_13757 [Streptomyces sp. BvitLS-983]SCE46253.1 hypothetical protein GA0115236_16055 [Streptomyces sp. IgraMP-1]